MNKIFRRKEIDLNSPLVVAGFLLVICILAYGLLIPTLGLYWDDWGYMFAYHRFGPAGYPAFVASDRPHSAWIFMGLTWLLGENVLGYHIVGVLVYWLCSVVFWSLIRCVWPGHEREALWAGLFFAIYPGFLGHPQAIIYNHHYTAMLLYLFSLITTVWAVKATKWSWYWHIPGVLAMSLSQISLEYYLGWEGVRVVLVGLLLIQANSSKKKRLRNGLKHLLPYFLGTMTFLAWRTFIFQFPTYQPVGTAGTITFSIGWIKDIFMETLNAVIFAWKKAQPILVHQTYSRTFWLAYIVLTTVSFFLVLIFLKFHHRISSSENNELDSFGITGMLTALTGIAMAGWPFWLVGLRLSINRYFNSRFTLAFIPWIALLFTVVFHCFWRRRQRWLQNISLVAIALLVGGSVGWHFWNANYYRNTWIEFQRYMQQLVTRVPGLEKGTTLVVNDMSTIELFEDDSIVALLNWIYAPDNRTLELDYMMAYLSLRLGNDIPALEPGLPMEITYRSMHFSGSTDQLLVVYYAPPGCLRVIDARFPDRVPLTIPQRMEPAVPLSNIDLIQTDPAKPAEPPTELFDLRKSASWCQYYQEAELAAQRGDWERVADLGNIAYAGEDQPNELTEHFVFIDGYLRSGRADTALDLSDVLSQQTNSLFDGRICSIWRSAARDTEPNGALNDEFAAGINQFCGIE